MSEKRKFGLMNKESLRFVSSFQLEESMLPPRFLGGSTSKFYKTDDLFYILKFFSNEKYENGHLDVKPEDHVAVEFEKTVNEHNQVIQARILDLPTVHNLKPIAKRDLQKMPEKVRKMYFEDELSSEEAQQMIAFVAEKPQTANVGDLVVIDYTMEVGVVKKISSVPESWPLTHTIENEDEARLFIVSCGTENVLKVLDEMRKSADLDEEQATSFKL